MFAGNGNLNNAVVTGDDNNRENPVNGFPGVFAGNGNGNNVSVFGNRNSAYAGGALSLVLVPVPIPVISAAFPSGATTTREPQAGAPRATTASGASRLPETTRPSAIPLAPLPDA